MRADSSLIAIKDALSDSVYLPYLELIPEAAQLSAFIALHLGHKKSADFWVPSKTLEDFIQLCNRLSLHWFVDGFFINDSAQERWQAKQSPGTTTTFASWSRTKLPNSEAHIFVAPTRENLNKCFESGWYPTRINNQMIPRHSLDDYDFGLSLGYPDCCVRYFLQFNEWEIQNQWYDVYAGTDKLKNTLNGLTKHEPLTYVFHLPCSAKCEQTAQKAEAFRKAVQKKIPELANLTDEKISGIFLVLSELRAFRLINAKPRKEKGLCISYESSENLIPTTASDPLGIALGHGNVLVLDMNIVKVFANKYHIYSEFCKQDEYGPECPFTIRFES